MSLLGKIFKTAKGALTGFVTGGPLGAVTGGLGGYAAAKTNLNKTRQAHGILPTTETFSASDLVRAGSGAVSMLPAIVRTGVGAVARRIPQVAGAVAVGSILYDQFGNRVTRKRRRMNPMNARAARRAIRRIKGARKMLQQIERQLPKQRAAAPRRSFGRNSETQFIRQG